jgi:2-polyprenyl-6-methoxyphenol hydroxylase-like FAD-dependent oxidoreductase
LKASGWNVLILERSPSLADRGAGIACMPQFLAFFKKFDRTKTTFWTHAAGRQHLRLDGAVMNFEPDFRPLDLTSWLATYAVARDNFDRDPDIPKEQLIRYCPSSKVAGYSIQDGKISVQYSQAGTLRDQEADVLVIAEGASSPQRQRLLPSVQRRYVGYVVFRGLVPESDLDPDLTASVAPFVTFYHGKGRDYIQFLCYLIPG